MPLADVSSRGEMAARLAWRMAGIALVVLSAMPRSAFGQQATPPVAGPFTKGVIGVELGGALLAEAWNFNRNFEWIADGTFAVSWAFAEGTSLVVEFHAAGIAQERPRTAFLNGIMPVMRFRVLKRGDTSMFIDLGAGVSWSDTVVPPRGTRFNYLIVTSLGFTHQLTRQVHAVASARLLHLSNASLMGRNRNPDIEAIGGYFGLFLGF